MKPRENPRFAIVVSQFNPEITQGLLTGAKLYLRENGVEEENIQVHYVPGAFEAPLIAQKLSKTKKFAGIICLGAVIKGDTAHFEFISLGATIGIMQAMLNTETPITFGILTTYTEEQAQARSGISPQSLPHNKGREAATACFEAVRTLSELV